jgi:uncharacterized protein with HEPN domain
MRLSILNKDKLSLSGILEAIEKIEVYTASINNAEELFKNEMHFDAVLMNFVIVGEMVERLSESFKSEHGAIDWTRIKAFRNIVAHDYFGIDAEEVWQIIKNHLPKLKQDIKPLL